MSRILIIGASGMLGCSLAPSLVAAGHQVIRQSRKDGFDVRLNLLNDKDWIDCFDELQPEVIVNLAAATNVDQCERYPQQAFEANVAPLTSLMRAYPLASIRPHIIHVSTDQVYEGRGPHIENNVRPCNVYGLSKLAAELTIKPCQPTILRTNFFGRSNSPGRLSFSDWIINSVRSNHPLTLFQDVLFNAVHLSTLCEYILLAIEKRTVGIFNVGTCDGASKYEFGSQLVKMLDLDGSMIKIGSVTDFEFPARRPLDMRMSITNFENAFSCKSPTMNSEIRKAANEYHF